ncbi:MAG: hypothetical protein RLN81_07770 [Balneolaceae bacterium]
MSTIISDKKTSYAWIDEKFSTPAEYATAVCIANGIHQFCAIWNPLTQAGYLGRWSPNSKTWLNLGGDFTMSINQMCVDTNGNVYMVGDRNAAGNYVIKIHNAVTGQWSEADDGITSPLTNICCDSGNNVYVAGTGTKNVLRYRINSNQWNPLNGEDFAEPIADLCVDADGTLYVLGSASGINFIAYWNGMLWNTISSPNFSGTSAICCDNSGNIYFNTKTTVMSYNVASKAFTDLNVTAPSYTRTDGFFLSHIDNTLYFAGFGYTSEVTATAFVMAYSSLIWKTITPPQLEKSFNTIYDITSYEGKSSNILVASDVNGILDGDQLIH